MTFKEAAYYVKFGIQCFLLKQRKPIVAGIPLTDACNLQCKHCVVANAGRGHYSIEKLSAWMRLFYSRGARILYIQGGEPFTWFDGEKRLNDVIAEARKIGYFKVAMVTNGTYPIKSDADAVWVSIDGTPKRHNEIRGENVFELAEENVEKSSHSNIRANMTVNSINYMDVEEVITFVKNSKKFVGVSINFHTPYPGTEDLQLPREKRNEVIKLVLELKKKGFPVLNSEQGLEALLSGKYNRPAWLIQMVEQDQIFECCWGREMDKVCDNCGYGVIAELSLLSELKLASVFHALKLF